MKRIIAIFMMIGFLSACDDKSCDDILCGTNQSCNQGICYCIDGFEGTDCSELASDKYIGSYNISKSCTEGFGGSATFGTIQYDGSPVNELLFFNFLGLGQTAYAFISTDQSGNGNYIRFPNQNLGAAEIVGEGNYVDFGSYGRLTIEIQSTINGQLSLCSYTYF